MFVDRELEGSQIKALVHLEDTKRWFEWSLGPRSPLDYDRLFEAKDDADTASEALVQRAMEVGRGRTRLEIARVQEEHDRWFYSQRRVQAVIFTEG